jgi:hypothetical protein
MKSSFLAIVLGLCIIPCSIQAFALAQSTDRSTEGLLVSPSKFKLLATNIHHQGESCSPSDKTDNVFSDKNEIIKVGNNIYYQAHRFYRGGRGDGLVVENFAAQTCRIYPMFGLAKAAGWFNLKSNETVSSMPNATGGLFRVGDTLWMGSNGFGVAIFDVERETWSRFDLKSSVIAGDHLHINYADDDYVFVSRGEFPDASLHVYSVKQNKWLGLKAVSTKLVREYGYTTGMVQVPVNHGMFAKADYMPIDWTFMGLTAMLTNNGQTYLFEKKFSETKTVFEISKSQLEQVFLKK